MLSLREAVGFANTAPSGDSNISFDSTVFNTPQMITLTGSQIELCNTSGTETITGPQAGVTVSGGGLSRVFQVDGECHRVDLGTDDHRRQRRLRRRLANYGTTTLTNCTVSGNSASNGGGLYNGGGTTTLTNCTVSGNSAGGGGGGLFDNSGTTTLTNCTVSGNSAARRRRPVRRRRTTTLTNCTVSGNSASSGGGGGLFDYWGTTTLTNCTVSGNSAATAAAAADCSTRRHDHADQLHRQRQLRQLTAAACTTRGTATLTNTIVAGNTARTGASDIGGFRLGQQQPDRHRRLGRAGQRGRRQHRRRGQPAAGPAGQLRRADARPWPCCPAARPSTPVPAARNIPATDQRGVARVGAVDIGAFESQGFTLTPVAGSTPQTSDIGTAFANPLAVTVTANNPIEPVDGGVVTFVANPVQWRLGDLSRPLGRHRRRPGRRHRRAQQRRWAVTPSSRPPRVRTGSFALTNTGPVFAAWS